MNFPDTQWTLIARATLHGDAAGRAALEELCRRYWPAVRDYLASRGKRWADAEDLTQDFFSQLLLSGGWHRAEQSRGKFRSFLLGALERTLVAQHRHDAALKRGGGQEPLSLDADDIPEPQVPPADVMKFDASWAERVLEMAMDALENEATAEGRATEFSVLLPFLSHNSSLAASAAAEARLGISASALKSRIFRLRQRFRDCVLAEISSTVETPHEAEQEMRYLFEILSQPGANFPMGAETPPANLPE